MPYALSPARPCPPRLHVHSNAPPTRPSRPPLLVVSTPRVLHPHRPPRLAGRAPRCVGWPARPRPRDHARGRLLQGRVRGHRQRLPRDHVLRHKHDILHVRDDDPHRVQAAAPHRLAHGRRAQRAFWHLHVALRSGHDRQVFDPRVAGSHAHRPGNERSPPRRGRAPPDGQLSVSAAYDPPLLGGVGSRVVRRLRTCGHGHRGIRMRDERPRAHPDDGLPLALRGAAQPPVRHGLLHPLARGVHDGHDAHHLPPAAPHRPRAQLPLRRGAHLLAREVDHRGRRAPRARAAPDPHISVPRESRVAHRRVARRAALRHRTNSDDPPPRLQRPPRRTRALGVDHGRVQHRRSGHDVRDGLRARRGRHRARPRDRARAFVDGPPGVHQQPHAREGAARGAVVPAALNAVIRWLASPSRLHSGGVPAFIRAPVDCCCAPTGGDPYGRTGFGATITVSLRGCASPAATGHTSGSIRSGGGHSSTASARCRRRDVARDPNGNCQNATPCLLPGTPREERHRMSRTMDRGASSSTYVRDRVPAYY